MANPTRHANGSPTWFELATTDQEGAKSFYAAVFGWGSADIVFPDGGGYTLFNLGGREVGAAYTLLPEQLANEVPAHWGLYFQVASADETASAVRAGGGRVLVEPYEVMEHVRMAVCADPEGAVFSVAQPRQHQGAGAVRETHAVCWVELAARDIGRAEAFYGGLFHWTGADHAASPTPYRMVSSADGAIGGLMQMDEHWGDMPSHWSIYLQVDDVDAIVARAQAAGGTLCFPAFDAPGVGRIARINDPAGAGFYVISFAAPAS